MPKGKVTEAPKGRAPEAPKRIKEPEMPEPVKKIPLRVDWPEGMNDARASWPVGGGVPLARGELREAGKACILDGKGEALRTAREAVAFWPDGSVKWLFCEWVGKPGEDYALGLFEDEFVEYETASMVARPVEGVIAVDTGKIRFTVKEGGCGFLEQVWLGDELVVDAPAEGERRNVLDYVHTPVEVEREVGSATIEGGEWDLSKLKVTKVEVERQSLLSVTIRIEGRYVHEHLSTTFRHPGGGREVPDGGTLMVLRIRAYRGFGFLKVFHTFVYEGDPDHDFPARMGLSLRMKERFQFMAQFGPARADVDPAQSLRSWMRTDGSAVMVEEHDRGRPGLSSMVRADAWEAGRVQVGDTELIVGIRDMRKLHPKAVEFGFEKGDAHAWLIPPQRPPLDLRRYSGIFGTGESESYGPGRATGISRTHECFFWFAPRLAHVEDGIKVLNDPPIVWPPADHTAATKVFGTYCLPKDSGHAKAEEAMTRLLEFVLHWQKKGRWYGIFDYGDIQSVMRGGRKNNRFERDWGRWGWTNDEACVTYMWMLHAFRSCRKDYYRIYEAMSRHVMDVDMIHTHAYPEAKKRGRSRVLTNVWGLGKRHNLQHWGDGYIGMRVTNPVGWRVLHCHSGYERARDCCEMVLRRTELSRSDHVDGTGSKIHALIFGWETSPPGSGKAAHYRDATLGLAKVICDHLKETGQCPANIPFDYANAKPSEKEKPEGDATQSFFLHTFGLTYGLEEIYDATGEAFLRDGLVRLGQAAGKRSRSWSWPYCLMRSVGTAYRLTGDRGLKETLEEMFARHGDFETGFRIPADRTTWDSPPLPGGSYKLTIEFWPATQLPFVLEALRTGGR